VRNDKRVARADVLRYPSAIVVDRATQIKRALVFLHRWMGVPFCLLFLMWFASGIAMMYWKYPMVSADDRLAHAALLDGSKIHLTAAEAYARLGPGLPPPSQARLSMLDGRPVYKFGTGADQLIVYADNGQEQTVFAPPMTRRIASGWSEQSATAAKEQDNVPQDQWTVSEEFAELRPLRKYTWAKGQQVYVSTVTGDVVQYTTRKLRLGAYLGPIPHWLYFTPLRKHGQQWSAVVIWVSGLATVVALLGIVVGLSMYSPSKRSSSAGFASHLPYVGWKHWHAILGLIFGILACTWAFSGMLSMDPFPRWQGERLNATAERLSQALRGGPISLAAFGAKSPEQVSAEAGVGIKELELTSFAGESVYLALAGPGKTRVVPLHGEAAAGFDRERIITTVEKAALPSSVSEIRAVNDYEAYYLDRRHRLPLPVILLELNDAENSAYYIDPNTARIVQSYTAASRRNRWFYHGLHSIDFPALYKYRPAWDLVVLTLMLGGTSLCITSVMLAWKVLRRNLR
jgi:hypothetical protein